MKSAGPKTSASSRGEDAAICSTAVSPRASSICASIPMRPSARPVACSTWPSSRSSQATWSGPVNLGQDDRVQVRPGLLGHVDHVTVSPSGGRVVDPHGDDLAAPLARGQRGDDVGPRLSFRVRRDRVFEVEQNLVRGQALGLGQEPRAAAWHRQAGAPGLVDACHVPPPGVTICSSGPAPRTAAPPRTPRRSASPRSPA